ncbi:hypothetical protein ONS95_013607 [Cadophora gregata]|uniref:uncharacterized protein n=1 Tax=Cadophora gregata TaxID=51156 RepID=UPI0026DC5176|nr:uncharacterized protein ONS95_013607 [Cadophora gregata]KAK0113353.1 hypothetical protein ONS96_014218 [Cadophora gregata f. sp. sojae]KAK0114103.1 hypothetical protein ONS95_013607 [Cadophora gregata]
MYCGGHSHRGRSHSHLAFISYLAIASFLIELFDPRPAFKKSRDYGNSQLPPDETPAVAASPTRTDAESEAWSTESEESANPQPRYASYKQYLDENVADWPELKWMQIFMNTPSGDPDDTRVTVIDSIDGAFHCQAVPITEPSNFSRVLESRGPEVKTRIIRVDYEASLCIDRSVVDTLGKTFDIDPLVFQEHFCHENLHCDHGYSARLHESIPKHRVAHLASQYRTSSGINLHVAFHSFTACVMLCNAERSH